jgi:chromate reductase
MKILGIAGSLREKSYNKGLLQAAVELAPAGMEIEIADISAIPPFNQDLDTTPPESVKTFKERIIASDGILFCTPEYNYSVPGVLKNAIDWASRPYGQNAWVNKTAAVTARAQAALRQSFTFLNVHCMNQPEIYVANAADRFSAEGKLSDKATEEHLVGFLEAFAQWIEKMTK